MSPRLQAHSAPAWLAQRIPFEDDEAVCVSHQQVKSKVEACPPPAVLRKRWSHVFFFVFFPCSNWTKPKCTRAKVTVTARRDCLTHISIFRQLPSTPHAAQLKLLFVRLLRTNDRQTGHFDITWPLRTVILWLHQHTAAVQINALTHYDTDTHPLSLSNSVRSIANHWFLYTDVNQSGILKIFTVYWYLWN